MLESSLAHASSAALLRAMQHWQARRAAGGPASRTPVTLTVSREAGSGGSTLAREVGRRLGWPVYDQELVQRIAEDMKLRVELLESVDEKHVDWLQECVQSFSSGPMVSEESFVRHLCQTLLSLSAHGECVIVGRGAAHVLPPASTLRVRLVAALEDRVKAVARELGLSPEEASRHVEESDRQRYRFVYDHFLKDPRDPLEYDLVLNTSHLSQEECADLVVLAVRGRQRALERRETGGERAWATRSA